MFCFFVFYLFLCAKYVVLNLYLVLSNRVVLVVLDIKITNYFASLFINICCFNSMFLANNKEIDIKKTIIYLQKIILFVIEEHIFVFRNCFFFLYSIFYNLLINNK